MRLSEKMESMKTKAKIKRPYTKLDMKTANLIRCQYWVHQIPQGILAKEYRTNQSTISHVVNFKSWLD